MGNQMREYTKPVMNVEKFIVKTAFADCGDEIYSPVDIPCLINTGSTDGVFYSGTGTNCTNYATTSNTITLDDGKTYFYWYGSAGSNPTASGTNADGYMIGNTLMQALQAKGISQSSGGLVLHAGAASTIMNIINAST